MLHLLVLGQVKVMEDSPCGNDARREVVDTESLERLHLEMPGQPVEGRIKCIDPVVEVIRIIFGPETFVEITAEASLKKHFLGLERTQQLVGILDTPLGSEKLAG